MLAEASTTKISQKQNPKWLDENKRVAKAGGNVAKQARITLEKQTGESIVSNKNAETESNRLLGGKNIKTISE